MNTNGRELERAPHLPEGDSRIARQFTAGFGFANAQVPKGRLNPRNGLRLFLFQAMSRNYSEANRRTQREQRFSEGRMRFGGGLVVALFSECARPAKTVFGLLFMALFPLLSHVQLHGYG